MADNDFLAAGGAPKPGLAPVAPPDAPQDKSIGGRFMALRKNSTNSTRRVANAMAGALGLGLLAAAIGGWNQWVPALLWAGACSAVGWALGFLFGIPRTLSTAPADGGNGTADPGSTAARKTATNTNLEQISDWLTKILVGVTLVQLGPVTSFLSNCAGVIATALGGPQYKSFALALMLYFSITGFLGSYLLTRLYLQPAFNEE